MLQDKAAQEIIKFAFSKYSDEKALKALFRAGQIASVYYNLDHGFVDFNDFFSLSNTK